MIPIANRPSMKRTHTILFGLGMMLFLAIVAGLFLILDKEALHDAARRGDVANVNELLDRDPGIIEERNRLGLTPLHVATWNGHSEVVELLLRRGANANATWDLARSGDGRWNSLHIAGIQGHSKVAELLIRGGADINAKTLQGETPLDIAIQNDHRQLAATLGFASRLTVHTSQE